MQLAHCLVIAFSATLPTLLSSFQSTIITGRYARGHRRSHTSIGVGRVADKPIASTDYDKNPPILNMICDERKEYEINLGKAIDTLKKDYPEILKRNPVFDIYTDDIEIVDPSGVTMHGLKKYETFFNVLRSVISFFYSEQSGLTFRLVYDFARNSIRVSWNAVLIPKNIYGGERMKMYLDGISVYDVDKSSGLIYSHRIEDLIINDQQVRTPNGIFDAVTNGDFGMGVPAMSTPGKVSSMQRQSTSLSMSSSSQDVGGEADNTALERKNASREKFGLPPISEEEFKEIQAEVQKIDAQTRQSAAELSSRELEKGEKGSFFSKLFGSIVDGCESNYDCERPQVCCDFIVKKECCASGVGIPQMQLKRVAIPGVPQDQQYPNHS